MAATSSLLAFANRISSRILRVIGIDADQFRALLRISLWIDFRGSAQALTGTGSTDNPLKGSLILYGVFSSLSALFVIILPAAAYARAAIAFGMLFLTMIMLVDFGVTLVVADDVRIVGWRPVNARTYFAARLANTLILISMFSIAMFLVPAIAGAFARHSAWWFPLVFLPSALLAGVFITGLIAACYTTLLRLFRPDRFRGVLNAFQVGFMIFIVLAGQVGPHIRHSKPRPRLTAIDSAAWSWLDWLPSNWFAAPTELLLHGPSKRVVALSGLAIFATIALFAVISGTLSLDYLERLAAAAEASPSGVSTNRGIALWRRAVAWALRTPEERVMFDFFRQIFLRDRKIRLRVYPSLAYAFVPGLLMLFRSSSDLHLLALAPAAILGLLPIPLLSQLPYWGESHGEWVFATTGFESIADLALGIKKGIFFTFQLPALILFSVPLFFFAGPAAAGAAMFFALGVGLFTLELTFLLISPGLPFTQEFTPGGSSGATMSGVVAMLALGVLGALAYFLANTPARLAVVALGLVLASLALDGIGNARFTIEEPVVFRGSGTSLFS